MSRHKILIVQENPRERVVLRDYLANMGFNVEGTFNGIEAEKILTDKYFEMIIADAAAPHLAPVDFLKYAKNKNSNTEVLFISEHPIVEDAVEVMKQGAFDFIIKPSDIEQLKEQLKLCAERVFLKKGGSDKRQRHHSSLNKPVKIITRDKEMKQLLAMAERIADSSASVFIQGESGTGKELFAKFIHQKSKRENMPFVAVNCAALPETLLESELFGHEKGAFTGAIARKPGKFELAHKGTLFLDEITEMPFHLQSKLLRVLQEQQFDRVGGTESVNVDVRVIATTNRIVKESLEKGEFREDLYYRLNTIPLMIPPLRKRRGDIGLLSDFFLKKYSIIDARSVKPLTDEAFDLLSHQRFSGNVRELENIIHRALLLAEKDLIEPCDLLLEGFEPIEHAGENNQPILYDIAPEPLKKMEEKMIFHTLDKTDGNRTHAAKILGISVRTLRNKLNEYKKTTKA